MSVRGIAKLANSMSSARPATTTPSRASSGAASRSVRSVVSRRRDHASATGSSDAGTPPSPARRRRRGGDGDEKQPEGAGNISGRTSRGLTKPYGAERPRRTRDGPERTSPSVPAGQRHTDRECDEGHGGDERVRQSGDHGDRRSDESDTDPAEQRRDVTLAPSGACLAGERDGEDDAGEVYGTEGAIETPTYEVRSRPFGGARNSSRRRSAARNGRTVPRRRGRERGTARASQPADDRVHDGRADPAIVESEGRGRAILERISRPTNACGRPGVAFEDRTGPMELPPPPGRAGTQARAGRVEWAGTHAYTASRHVHLRPGAVPPRTGGPPGDARGARPRA